VEKGAWILNGKVQHIAFPDPEPLGSGHVEEELAREYGVYGVTEIDSRPCTSAQGREKAIQSTSVPSYRAFDSAQLLLNLNSRSRSILLSTLISRPILGTVKPKVSNVKLVLARPAIVLSRPKVAIPWNVTGLVTP
jgi:hypothetical protein